MFWEVRNVWWDSINYVSLVTSKGDMVRLFLLHFAFPPWLTRPFEVVEKNMFIFMNANPSFLSIVKSSELYRRGGYPRLFVRAKVKSWANAKLKIIGYIFSESNCVLKNYIWLYLFGGKFNRSYDSRPHVLSIKSNIFVLQGYAARLRCGEPREGFRRINLLAKFRVLP